VKQFFDRPQLLLLIAALAPALLFFRFRQARLCAALEGLSRGGGAFLARTVWRRALFFSAAWACLVIALSGPRIGTRLEGERQEGVSVLYVFDISRSMTVEDVPPNRLSFAAGYAGLLSSRLGPVPSGVVLAKGNGILAVPLTTDSLSVQDLFDSLSPALSTSPGSSLSLGIRAALDSFPEKTASARAIVLFTDGDETSGSVVEAAREAGERGVSLSIVGVGTPQGAPIDADPDPERTEIRQTSLRESLLRSAAEAAGPAGLYVNALDSGSAVRVIELIKSLGSGTSELRYREEPVSRIPEFAFASGVFLSLALVSGGLVRRRERLW